MKREEATEADIQPPDQVVDAYIQIDVAKVRFVDICTKTTSGSRVQEMVELHQMIVEAEWNGDTSTRTRWGLVSQHTGPER